MLMAFTNFKVSRKNMILLTTFLFTNVFNLRRAKPTTLQALSHSWWPLPLFFIQVVIFCKANWTFFNDTCVIPTHTLSFEVTYYHVLFMACPKHAFAYGNVNCNGSQLTTCKRINAKTFKLLPS